MDGVEFGVAVSVARSPLWFRQAIQQPVWHGRVTDAGEKMEACGQDPSGGGKVPQGGGKDPHAFGYDDDPCGNDPRAFAYDPSRRGRDRNAG